MAKHFQSKDNPSPASSRRAAAHVQAKMKVGQKEDRFEKEADHAAAKATDKPEGKRDDEKGKPVVGKVSKVDADFGKKPSEDKAAKLEKEKAQKKKDEKPAVQKKDEDAESKAPKKKEPVQKSEKEAAQSKSDARPEKVGEKKEVQKINEKEEPKKEKKTAPKTPEKKEPVQKKNEEAQSKIQREPQEAQDAAMSADMKEEREEPVQKQSEEEEEEAQMKVQKQSEEEEEEAQMKVQKQSEEEEEMQAKTEPRANVRDKKEYPVLNSIEPILLRSRGMGEPMPEEVRMEMETKFGADFRKVRIHTAGYAVWMAREIKAQAFTSGSDIYFNSGKYDPDSLFGKILLAHELTHVIQQGKAEQKLSETKIAESNASRNEPLPSPIDKDAKKTKEQIEKEKKEVAEKEMKKGEKQEKKSIPMAIGTKSKSKSPAKTREKLEEKEGEKEMTVVGLFLKKMSEARVAKKKKKLARLARNQKKKDDAKTKLEQSQKAVVPPSEESQSRANASQVETVNKSQAPKPDEKKAKKEFDKAMEKAVPSSLEAMDEFKEKGKGRIVGEQVKGVVTADTQEVQTTYREIENTPEPAPADTPEEMPPTEVAPKTSAINMGDDVIGEVQPEHTDMSEFEKKSDKKMEEEEISDEQLDMVDSGPLAEANKDRKKLKEKVQTGPKEVKELEKNKKKEMSEEMKKEEKKGRKEMKNKRKKELKNTKNRQKKTKKTIEQKRQAVTDHINGIYKTTNDKVKKKLEDLEKQSLKTFDQGQATATKTFEDNVKRRLDRFKDSRYSGWFGWARWLKDKLLGMEDLPEVKRIFDSEKATFISNIDRLIAKITADNKKVIQECKDMVKSAREKIADYVSKLGPDLRKTGKKAQADMQKKLDALDKTVNKKEEELKKKLDEKRKAAIKAIEEKIESMKEELSGLAGKLAALLLAALLKFFTWALEKIGGNSDKIMGVVNKSKKVIKKIVKSPGKFIGNLGKAVKMGFKLFQTNFKKHLIGGIVEWLTGALGGTEIKMPAKFDLKGVMSLGLQILGLTWQRIRHFIVKKVGEPVMAAAEKGMDLILKIKDKGFIVLWDMLVEKAQELKDKVLKSISGWAVIQIVKAATIKLLMMLNPAGAILQIALTIYDAVMWFIENMQRILDFIMSIFNSIAEIAFGQLGKAASFIEKALAKIIPIILSFLARWLKLAGIGKAIKMAVKKVRSPIDKVMKKVINFIVKGIRKFVKKGKGAAKKIKDKLVQWWKAKTTFTDTSGKKHKLYYKGKGRSAKLIMESDPTPIDAFLDKVKEELKKPENKKFQRFYNQALGESKQIKTLEKGLNDPKIKPKNKKKVFDKLSGKLKKVAKNLSKLAPLLSQNEVPDAVLPSFTNNVKARSFEAVYISNKTPKGQPASSNPGTLPGWYWLKNTQVSIEDPKDETKTILVSVRERDNYVRMHLLHEDLGGKATDSNLTPVKSFINSPGFYNAMEKHAITDVKKGEVLWYKVMIKYHKATDIPGIPASVATKPKYNAFPEKVSAKYGFLKNKKGKWEKQPARPHKFEESGIDKPDFTTSVVRSYLINKQSLRGAKGGGFTITHEFDGFLRQERTNPAGGGPAKPYSNLKNAIDRLQARHKARLEEHLTTTLKTPKQPVKGFDEGISALKALDKDNRIKYG